MFRGLKLKRVLSDIDFLLEANCCTARELSALAGHINSFKLAVGNVTTLMTTLFICPSPFSLVGTLDHEGVIYHLPWTANVMFRSSTWRELKAVYTCLSSFSVVLSGRAVQWFTDNRNIPSIIRNGSMKRDLHEISLSIFQIVLRNGIDLQVDWIPRHLNEHADAISRIVDFDDWGVSFEFFRLVDNIWGPHSVDRFANSHNRKLPRFFSRFWNPDSEGVDAFCVDWAGENNWLVPPVSLVPRVIRHLFVCRSMCTLIVPKWVSAPFWPMLFGPHSPFFLLR